MLRKKEEKIWKLRTADKKFAELIRKRDKKCCWQKIVDGKLITCNKTTGLHCSHFHDRIHSATRFDFDNCDTLCFPHHYGNIDGWEHDKPGEYRDFKIKQLGLKKFNELDKKHRTFKPRHEAIKEFMLYAHK